MQERIAEAIVVGAVVKGHRDKKLHPVFLKDLGGENQIIIAFVSCQCPLENGDKVTCLIGKICENSGVKPDDTTVNEPAVPDIALGMNSERCSSCSLSDSCSRYDKNIRTPGLN